MMFSSREHAGMTTASCKSCLQQRLCSHSAPCSLLPSPPPPPSSLYPNVDFYSGIVLRALGIPVEMYTVLFAMARTVGWVAQVSRRRAVCGLCVAGRSRAGEWRGSGGPCRAAVAVRQDASHTVRCSSLLAPHALHPSAPPRSPPRPAPPPAQRPPAVEGDGCGRDWPHHAPPPDLHRRAAPQVHPRVRAPAVRPHLGSVFGPSERVLTLVELGCAGSALPLL